MLLDRYRENVCLCLQAQALKVHHKLHGVEHLHQDDRANLSREEFQCRQY